MSRLRLVLVAALLAAAVPGTAGAHSYADPALRTVLDGVQPAALPADVAVTVVPSVVDQLVVTNPTPTDLEVLGADGLPFLRISAAGVLADLSRPDWYLTGVPEGAVVPASLPSGPRWARVSAGSTWAEFDPRLHPPVTPTAAQRRAGREAVLTTWSVPLRYGERAYAATGHVVFSPVRGAFQVAVTRAPSGLTATALQGELPGLFVRAARPLVVAGRDGRPFLSYDGGRWIADRASASWVDQQRARGEAVATAAAGTAVVARGPSYSWLDPRLRYPHDLPPADRLARTTVVQRWRVPVTVDGGAGAIEGTVTWVPRAVALRPAAGGRRRWAWLGGAAALSALTATALVRQSRGVRA